MKDQKIAMKPLFTACLAMLLFASPAIAQNSDSPPTDINPALLYYQAFQVAPHSDPDRDYLYTNEWKAPHLDAHFGELIGQYDNTFRLVRLAARSKAPCDWGIDWSTGPATLLPQLAQAKAVVIAARQRVKWELQNGREDDAREDLVAALALGRNLTRDGSLISVLVQLAIENIICSSVAENFCHFSPDQLQKIVDGIDACPPRRTVLDATTSEKSMFIRYWLEGKVKELRQSNSGDDRKAMEGIRKLVTSAEFDTNFWPRVEKASRGTSEGVVRLLHEYEDSYQQIIAPAVTLPAEEFQAREDGLKAELTNSPNPFIAVAALPFLTSRQREFRVLAYLALVHAGVEYKLRGEAGLNTVPDPCGKGPFKAQHFSFEGVDRGFKLTSAYNMTTNKAALIFVEKAGPPFFVDGNHAGNPITPQDFK